MEGGDMGKRIYICLLLVMTASLASSVYGQVNFFDDFESYTVGQQPSFPWFTLANQTRVTDDEAYSGQKSLHVRSLFTSAVIDISNSYQENIAYECYVKLNDQNDGFHIGFFNQISNQAPQFNCVHLKNGKVRFVSGDANFPIDEILQDYFALNVWHKIRAEFDFNALTAKVYMNNQLIGNNVSISPKNATYQLYDTTYNFPLEKIGVLNYGGNTVFVDNFAVTNLPTATTQAATSVTTNSAMLNGAVNPNSAGTTYYFEYGETTSYGSSTATQSAGSGSGNVTVNATISSLDPNTTYHFRLVAQSSAGTTSGSDQSFTTGANPPTATTHAATSVTTNSATLNGSVNSNSVSTTYYFEYGKTTSYGSTTVTQSAGAGGNDVEVNVGISSLDENTIYHFRLVAENSIGKNYGSDLSFVTEEVQSQALTKVIIVAGGGPYPGNNLWEATKMVASAAYMALVYQGISKDDIYYLSPEGNTIDADDNGYFDDISADATNSNLKFAIETWAQDAENLLIFPTDHGGQGKFLMRQNEFLLATELDSWIDAAEAVIPGNVIVVYDACRSGSFFSYMTTANNKQRVFISSTGKNQNALFADKGVLSFGYMFWSRFLFGDSFYDSYVKAKDGISLTYENRQTPHLDANGNGVSDEREDKDIARGLKLGKEIVSGYTVPSIGRISSPIELYNETSFLIFAEDVVDIDGIRRVWATILPPDFNSGSADNPVTSLPFIELNAVGGNRYEGVYDNFTSEGAYHISVFATDLAGNISLPKATTVTHNCALLDSSFKFSLPCMDFQGYTFGITFKYINDLFWEADVSTLFETPFSEGCITFNNVFSFTVPLMELTGTRFKIKFDYYGQGLMWTPDLDSIEIKN